jgi:hypothetical protein
MSFINTIEDDSDQVELIVRQRFEAKPGCDIVGFDAYDQATAVTQLSTDLESNSSRVDGLVSSLSTTDASIVALNTDLLSNLTGVRTDLESNANILEQTITDLNANVVLIDALRTDVDSNAGSLVTLTTYAESLRQDVDSNAGSLVTLTSDVLQDIENLSSNVQLIEALRTDVDSNSASLLSVIEDVSSNVLLIEALREDVDSNASILVTTNALIDNVQESIGTVAQLQALMDGTLTDAEASALTGTLVGTLYSILQTHALKTSLIALEQTVNGLNFATNTGANFFDSLDDFLDDDGNDTSTALQRQVIQNKDNIATHTTQISDLNSLAQTNADEVATLRNRTNDLSTKIVTEVWGQSVIDSLTYTTQEDLETALVNQPSRVDTLKTDYTALNSSLAGALTSLASLTGDGEQAGEVTQLRTDLTSNVGRLDTVIGDLSSNSARISTVSSDLASHSSRISTLESAGTTGDISPTNVTASGNITVADSLAIGHTTPLSTRKLHIKETATEHVMSRVEGVSSKDVGYELAHTGASSYWMNFIAGGEDKLRWWRDGTKMVLDENGSLGIGLSPACKLDIAGEDVMIRGNTPSLNFSEGTNGMDGAFRIHYDGANENDNDNFLAVQYGTGFASTSLHMTLGGKVGCGTSNPSHPLDVVFSGDSGIRAKSTSSHASLYLDSDSGYGYLRFQHSGADKFWLQSSPSGDLAFRPSGGGHVMDIKNNGNVGLNQSSPSYKLDVNGDTRVVGKLIVQTNNDANGVICTGTNGGSSSYGYKDGDPGVKFRGYDALMDGVLVKVLDLVPAPGGTPRAIAMNLGSDGERWLNIYTSKIYRQTESGYSDDRIKTGETLVENATQTLLKLKPQTYDKHSFEFDKFTEEEFGNVSSENTVFSAHSNCWADQTELIENTIDQAEQFPYVRRRLSAKSEKETGLIAQDVWYDAPELRHIVSLPSDATPAEDKPTGSLSTPLVAAFMRSTLSLR